HEDEEDRRHQPVDRPRVRRAQPATEMGQAHRERRAFHLFNVPVGARAGIGPGDDIGVHPWMYGYGRIALTTPPRGLRATALGPTPERRRRRMVRGMTATLTHHHHTHHTAVADL